MEIFYFARIREQIGQMSEQMTLPENISDLDDLMDYLQTLGENYQTAFDNRAAIRAAVNQLYVDFDHPVHDSDEVAFFPPMTGG